MSDSHCSNCGTRLLLIVFPQSLQFDTNQVPSYYEDHLLERISFLELRFKQMSEAMKISIEIIREQGKKISENRQQIKLLKGKTGKQFEEKTERKSSKPNDSEDQLIESLMAEHDSPNVDLFSKLLAEALKLRASSDEKEAFRMFERAVLLSPRNSALLFFTAQNYFFADKFAESRKHLERLFELSPDNSNMLLLLGSIYADEGETEKARLYLSILVENEKSSFIVNLIWAIMSAFEENWRESLAALKAASQIKNTPEINYLTGCVYFELEDFNLALEHFERAIEAEENYADVWFMKAVVYNRSDKKNKYFETLQKAQNIKVPGAQSAEFLRKNNANLEHALPFMHFRKPKSRLLSGGAIRLLKFIKNEIAKAIEQ